MYVKSLNFTGDDSFDYKLEYDFFSNILTKPMIQYQVILYKILLLHFLFGRGFFLHLACCIYTAINKKCEINFKWNFTYDVKLRHI